MTDSEIQEIRESLKEINKKLDVYHEATVTLHTVVLGKDGDIGLVGTFEKTRDDLYEKMEENCSKFEKFKSKCILVLGILVGSGVLGGGAAALINYL